MRVGGKRGEGVNEISFTEKDGTEGWKMWKTNLAGM